MNRLVVMLGLIVFLAMPQAWAQSSKYPDPYRQTMWNDITDSIHTMGQTPQQAAWTKRKLHQKRNMTRLNDINRAKRQAWMDAHSNQ
jgi:hypothetical protein